MIVMLINMVAVGKIFKSLLCSEYRTKHNIVK